MMTIDRNHLSHDVPILHGLIIHLLEGVEEQKQIIAQQQIIIDEQKQQIMQLTQRVSLLEKQLYGCRSERLGKKMSTPVSQDTPPTGGSWPGAVTR